MIRILKNLYLKKILHLTNIFVILRFINNGSANNISVAIADHIGEICNLNVLKYIGEPSSRYKIIMFATILCK